MTERTPTVYEELQTALARILADVEGVHDGVTGHGPESPNHPWHGAIMAARAALAKAAPVYNHMVTVAFTVCSRHPKGEDFTPVMLRSALLARIEDLDRHQEWLEAVGAPEDTFVEPMLNTAMASTKD